VIQVPVKEVPDDLTPAEQRKPAPDFTLDDMQGRPVTLSELKGKVVLLDFWATWCPACQFEIPWYLEFEKKYKDQTGEQKHSPQHDGANLLPKHRKGLRVHRFTFRRKVASQSGEA
jgi:thiol-disulfide isomerase/thioredoxin